jgi:hypothetical protein
MDARLTGAGRFVGALYVVVALINFAPIAGVISAAMLESMYAISVATTDLAVLLRHRAVLLAIVGALLFAASRRAALRPFAAAAGFTSMGSNLALVALEPSSNEALRKVAAVDLGAIVLLALAVVIDRRSGRAFPT